MSNIYFTVTGLHHYYGDSFLEKEMIVYLKKEKDNEYDKEAISVNLSGLGKIGYVANSPYTVLGESYSAGRLYDKISEEASGKVKFDASIFIGQVKHLEFDLIRNQSH